MVLSESKFSNIQTLEFKFSDGNNDEENILLKNDDGQMKILSEQDGIAVVVEWVFKNVDAVTVLHIRHLIAFVGQILTSKLQISFLVHISLKEIFIWIFG